MPSASKMTYARILGDEYGIDLWTIAGCVVTDEITENAAGFNRVMVIAIEDRFGDGILDHVWERAEQEYERELANAGR